MCRPVSNVWVHATCELNPMLTPGEPISEAPYTSSSPGMVSWFSHKRVSPVQGRCGFATSMPRLLAECSLPSAQAFEPKAGGGECQETRSLERTPSRASSEGGAAAEMESMIARELANMARSRPYADRSAALI